ncbi:MAG: family 78 glycoside hydrolase catalytic domain [Clostridia bacterium]|nr:family 78 glycoside hydrolase catalytic domain [Clostridia bacterium]
MKKQDGKNIAFEKSKWIWIDGGDCPDEYADFKEKIEYTGERVFINISCDSDYTLYVNGKYAASNQYGDFEHYKIYDTVDITEYLKKGENDIYILGYHCGVATQRYRPYKAGIIYEIVSDGKIVCVSSEKTLSRKNPAYESGKCRFLSTQLGFTFSYDATRENDLGYRMSVCVDKNTEFYPRPIKKLSILKDCEPISVEKRAKNRYLVDFGREIVGFASIDISSDTEQMLEICFGEHIDDGEVRKIIGNRSFFFEYKTKIGRNTFTDHMLRLACRYIEIFSEDEIIINNIMLVPQAYEVKEVPVELENALDRDIYKICVNTLSLCMMEHYVDCPWREQALYAFDSRNQMLCGYYAFENGNLEYARANLKLIGMDRREDGLLSICYPCGTSLAIPSFSLYYLIAMSEYTEHTLDTTLASEMMPKMISVCDEFFAQMKNGLIEKRRLDGIWNFYDWSEYLDGSSRDGADLIINCLFVIALDALEKMCNATNKVFPYPERADELRKRIKEEFFTPNGYKMHRDKEEYTALGNSLAIISGVETEKASFLCDKLVNGDFTEMSLSMRIFKYQALLQTDSEKYNGFILDEMRKSYKKMLDYGSSTVWETIDGASAFDNAGSLCHGWSAIPVYIYHRLGMVKKKYE